MGLVGEMYREVRHTMGRGAGASLVKTYSAGIVLLVVELCM